MFAEKTLAVAARIERIEASVAQVRADLQRLDRKLDLHVETLRAEIRELIHRASTGIGEAGSPQD